MKKTIIIKEHTKTLCYCVDCERLISCELYEHNNKKCMGCCGQITLFDIPKQYIMQDIKTKERFTFYTLEEAERFSDLYQQPEHLISR